MGEQFWVDTEGLERSGGNYDSASGQVNRVASKVNADASAFDGCWGNDSAGKQFAPGYLTNKKSFVDGVTQLADVLQATADGVRIMAKNFADMEHRNTDIASKLNMKVVDDSAGGDNGDSPPPSESGSTEVHGRRHTALGERVALKSTRVDAAEPRAQLREGEVQPGITAERPREFLRDEGTEPKFEAVVQATPGIPLVPAERVMGLTYEPEYTASIPATPVTPVHPDQA